MHTAKSPSWLSEKNSSTPPLQTIKINGLKSSWLSRGHIRAPQIYDNVLHRWPSGVAIACVGAADGLPGAEIVLQRWGRAWVSIACVRGCICLWPKAQGSSPLPLQPWQTAAQGSFQLAATGQGFPSGKYLNKVCPGRYPRSVPNVCKTAGHSWAGESMCVCIYVYVCIYLYTPTDTLHSL